MITRLIAATHPNAIQLACEVIRAGGLIAFPTDTLYGLGCDPHLPAALQKIYAAKGRSMSKAIPVLISHPDQLNGLVSGFPKQTGSLMEHWWPGALTLVLPKNSQLPPDLTPYPGLAVRMPDHPLALALLDQSGPLAVTSANLSDHDNPRDAQGVLAQLDGLVNLVLDGGELIGGQASTIIDCLGSEPKLLREGPIPFPAILERWYAG
ncbi:MAG TPA: L-threonylcarbamoyladenylate synthase [Anaerolineaceae bacterium]|nr:L-threonylcarbamoyladenylate synthase [Anaerolineaceae bacterium]